ncbi:MAG: hypothetical protein ABIG61_00120 [Planctomycetota bacterium]
MVKYVIYILMVFIALLAPQAVALEDDFDDGVIDTSTWVVTGSPVESGTLLSGVNGDAIDSIDQFQYESARIILRNIYDSRNLGDYTTYTLGYTGFVSSTSNEFILIRNDNAGGGVLQVEVAKADGTTKVLGSISVSNGVTHDIEVQIFWSASEIKVVLNDLSVAGATVLTETDPAWIPDDNMVVKNYVSQVANGTWDLDYAATGYIPVQPAIEDDFDDASIDTNIWMIGGSPVESGTLVSCVDGDSISSKSIVMPSDDWTVIKMRNVYDSRNLGDYTKYTLGYSGLIGGYYVLARTDNAGGGRVNIQLYGKYGVAAKVIGNMSIGDGQEHDLDLYIQRTAAKVTVVLHDLTTSDIATWTETDPDYIFTGAMSVMVNCSQVNNGTLDVDYAAVRADIDEPLSDDFDDGVIDPNLWTVTSGDPCEAGTLLMGAASDVVISNTTMFYQKVQYGLRNLFDDRNLGNYSRWTGGYSGLIGRRFIIARNESSGSAGYLWIQVQPRYGVLYEACRLNLGDSQTHDIDISIDWRSDYLKITMDDLTTGAHAEYETTDTALIPNEAMSFMHLTNSDTTVDETFDLDYVNTGPVCGDNGYFDVDLNRDCDVDGLDLAEFVDIDGWLNCNNTNDSNCPEFVPDDDSPSGITRYTAFEGSATVDGNLSDWATNAPWTPMKKLYDGSVPDANNAWFACRYDAATDLLYCAVMIDDVDQWFEMTYMGWNQQDDIEVYVAGDVNAAGDPFGTWAQGQQYTIGNDGLGGSWAVWPDTQPVGSESPAAGLTWAVAINGNRIAYEFSVKAWDNFTGKGGGGSNLQTDLYTGKVIRFDVVCGSRHTNGFGMLCANSDGSKAYDVAKYATLVCTDGSWASYLPADFDEDNYVDFEDFAELASKWLMCTDPLDPECVTP